MEFLNWYFVAGWVFSYIFNIHFVPYLKHRRMIRRKLAWTCPSCVFEITINDAAVLADVKRSHVIAFHTNIRHNITKE